MWLIGYIGMLNVTYWTELNKYKTISEKHQKGSQDRDEAPKRSSEANFGHGSQMRLAGGNVMARARQQGINRT